jgi:hypothetical protein
MRQLNGKDVELVEMSLPKDAFLKEARYIPANEGPEEMRLSPFNGRSRRYVIQVIYSYKDKTYRTFLPTRERKIDADS